MQEMLIIFKSCRRRSGSKHELPFGFATTGRLIANRACQDHQVLSSPTLLPSNPVVANKMRKTIESSPLAQGIEQERPQ